MASGYAFGLLNPSTFNGISSAVCMSGDEDGFVSASTLADSPEYESMWTYHFVHVRADIAGNCLPYDEALDCGFKGSGQCLVTGIPKYVGDILENVDDRKNTAVVMLVHLMADLHQPLHVGFAKDHGGIDIVLSSPENYNLHQLWDEYLLVSSDNRPVNVGLIDLLRREKRSLLALWPEAWDSAPTPPSTAQITAAVKQWIVNIVTDISHTYTCPKAYMTDVPSWIVLGARLDMEYLADRSAVAQRLVRLAGVRLAALLNRIGKFMSALVRTERKKLQKPVVPRVESPTGFESPNKFAGLVVDEFVFDPKELVFNEEADDIYSLLPRIGGATAPPPVIFDGIVLSDLVLYNNKRHKSLCVTYRSKVVEKRVGRDWVTFDFFFPLNAIEKKISIHFDLDIMIRHSRGSPNDLVQAIIYYIRGVGVPKSFKSSTASKTLLTAPPTANVKYNYGMFEQLPVMLHRNISPLEENLYISPFEKKEFVIEGVSGPIRMTKATLKKRRDKLKLQEQIAKAHSLKFSPTLTDLSEQLANRSQYMLERACGKIIRTTSSDGKLAFITTIGSLEKSDKTTNRPLMAHAFELHAAKNTSIAFLTDATLSDTLLTDVQVRYVNECAMESGLTSYIIRPSLQQELNEIQNVMNNPDLQLEPNSMVNQLMVYFNPITRQIMCISIEWDKRTM